jgi:Glycosyltransferase family 87
MRDSPPGSSPGAIFVFTIPVQGISKLGLSLLLAGCMWFYVQHVLIPHQRADAALYGTPRGNLSDLYPRWLGARELLLQHRDPYGQELTREIQIGYYGRALDPTRPEDPTDQQGFAYPVYVVFLLAPTVTLPFAVVQAGFRWLLIFLTVATVLLWLRVLRWRPSTATTTAVVVLTLGSFPILQGVKLQQLSLLVAGLIAGCVALLDGRSFFLAGVLLALATIKPQLVLLLAAWLLLSALSDWPRRKNVVWGFVGTLAILCGAAEYVLPGWLGRFREAMAAYRQYNGGAESVLDVLVTPGWGRVLAALALLVLLLLGWRLRRVSSDSLAFAWMLALTLAVTVMVVPKAAPYNQVLLLPGILLAAQRWQVLWEKNRLTRIVAVLACVLILWPWLAAVTLTIASLFVPNESVQKAWAVPVYTSLVIPIAVVAVLSFCLSEFANLKSKVSGSPRK